MSREKRIQNPAGKEQQKHDERIRRKNTTKTGGKTAPNCRLRSSAKKCTLIPLKIGDLWTSLNPCKSTTFSQKVG